MTHSGRKNNIYHVTVDEYREESEFMAESELYFFLRAALFVIIAIVCVIV